jgi:hypothetical protein
MLLRQPHSRTSQQLMRSCCCGLPWMLQSKCKIMIILGSAEKLYVVGWTGFKQSIDNDDNDDNNNNNNNELLQITNDASVVVGQFPKRVLIFMFIVATHMSCMTTITRFSNCASATTSSSAGLLKVLDQSLLPSEGGGKNSLFRGHDYKWLW